MEDNKKDVTRLICSILLTAFAVFAVLSFYSLSPNDPPFGDYPVNNPIKNYCGKAGANLAGYMMLCLGVTSYIPFVLLGIFGVTFSMRREIKDLWVKCVGIILILVCLPPIIYLASSIAKNTIIKPGFAGIFGLISALRLTSYLGIAGTCLLLFAGLFIALILITDARINRIFTFLFRIKSSINKDLKPIPEQKEKNRKNLFMFFSFFKKLKFPKIKFPKFGTGRKDNINPAMPTSKYTSVNDNQTEQMSHFLKTDNVQDNNVIDDNTVLFEKAHSRTIENIENNEHHASNADDPDFNVTNESNNIIVKKSNLDETQNRPIKKLISNRDYSDYTLPTIDLLEEPGIQFRGDDRNLLMERASILQMTLKQFNVDVRVVEIEQGPVITMFELELAPGVKLAKILALADDLAIVLKAPSVRVVAPLPKKASIGLEVPNTNRSMVKLKDVITTGSLNMKKQKIPLVLGKDVSGASLISDMAAMPHLLIAGTTGSGKSVCLNTIILSILCFQRPDQVKLLLVDPKMVEFSPYSDVPHLISPIITDMKKASAVLEWAVNKMEERYALLSSVGVRNIDSYNALGEEEIKKKLNPHGDVDLDDVPFHLPYIVIIVDELADLMMVAAKEVEGSVIRLSQKSRAVGIHLILATQRPSVNVVTGLIKSNMPARISFYVASKIDSRTILDQNGAEKLLGSGDMLFLPPGTSKLVRSQGAFVSDKEVKNIVDFLKARAKPEYSSELKAWKGSSNKSNDEEDELFSEAVRIVLESQRGSVSLVQRRLGIGYSRASRLIDLMADDGIIGEYKGSQAREVFLTLEEWDNFKHEEEV